MPSSLVTHPVLIGLTIRLVLAWLLPLLLDHGDVPYTDIDYHVFSDAADHVRQGRSPYDRTTYRYTPFLAELLACLPPGNAGRYLFCIADVLCGWILWQARQQQRQQSCTAALTTTSTTTSTTSPPPPQSRWWYLSAETKDALWWLYNPLAINICTRGSAESFMVLLPVLGTVWCVQQYSDPRTNTWSCRLGVVLGTGLLHGISMHSKVYPVIYSLSFATALSPTTTTSRENGPSLGQWIRGFFTPTPLLFGATALGTAAALTVLAVQRHGPIALQEGLLYHASRVDHRHNYSMHWYGIYLARDYYEATTATTSIDNNSDFLLPWMGRLLLVPQAVWLIVTSWKLSWHPKYLTFCLFLQTLVFVAQNKVITAQYFTWYLCLLPFCVSALRWDQPTIRRRLVRAVASLLISVVLWLGSAYLLEMQGWAVHRLVWIASVLFYAAHANLVCAFLDVATPQSPSPDGETKKVQ
mmetsp:Transcript_6824/g.13108  ORF Transcript_6824/g.13108 Transcript_6824/m.13108 type:complete len:469 (-) Transcript_6824:294-1700(-)